MKLTNCRGSFRLCSSSSSTLGARRREPRAGLLFASCSLLIIFRSERGLCSSNTCARNSSEARTYSAFVYGGWQPPGWRKTRAILARFLRTFFTETVHDHTLINDCRRSVVAADRYRVQDKPDI